MSDDSVAVVDVVDQTEKFRLLSATANTILVPTNVAIALDRPQGAVS